MIHDDIRLGRVAGVPLAVNWSVLVIVGLLTWGLAETVLPETAPGHTAPIYWITGLGGAFVFLGSLLAHEMAHAVVARRSGVTVEGMTLWLFGGIAKLGGQPANASADFRIAVVGPATSLVLSVIFGATALWLGLAGMPDLAVAVVAWLAAINLVLGLFNLVPGAPLDGGRVLRALLWRHHGDWARAAVSASRAGQIVGYGLIGLGLAELLFVGIGGLWMMLIGWFVLVASQAEGDHVVTETALRDVRVGDVMTASPQTAPGGITVQELIEHYLLGHPHSGYPVEDPDGRIQGLVTLRQLRAVAPRDRHHTRVADIALPLDEVTVTSPDHPLVSLLDDVDELAGGRALVFEHGRLAGIVTPTDITRAIDVRSAARPAPR